MIYVGLAADGVTPSDRMALAAEDVRTVCRRIAAALLRQEQPNAK